MQLSSRSSSAGWSAVMRQYEVDPQTGFLPRKAPLRRLPPGFAAWEALARDFSARLHAGCLAPAVARLPRLDPAPLPDGPALERAMRLLGLFAHGYLQTPEGQAERRLPASLAQPWVAVAARLGRPPVLSHASLVLHNWRRLDPGGPLTAANLAPLEMFLGGQDEAWFYTLTAEIEAVGAAALRQAVRLRLALAAGDTGTAAEALHQMAPTLADLAPRLLRMTARCDPQVFFHRIRPFLASLTAVHYEGVNDPLRSYAGGSAAQSSLLQSFDAVLGVVHPEPGPGAYLRDMRAFMPPAHARFVAWLGSGPPPDTWAKGALGAGRAACIQALLAFRQAHLRLVARYIIAPAREAGLDTTGTGGTDPIAFLKAARNDTGQAGR